MVSVTLMLSVEAFNVLVLIPLAKSFDLISCPDPSIWDQKCLLTTLMVVQM